MDVFLGGLDAPRDARKAPKRGISTKKLVFIQGESGRRQTINPKNIAALPSACNLSQYMVDFKCDVQYVSTA